MSEAGGLLLIGKGSGEAIVFPFIDIAGSER